MIREDKFLISRRPYAVDLNSLCRLERDPDKTWAWYMVDAVWFRGRKSDPVACIGTLRTIIDDPAPADARAFLERYTDGRYGGDCHGRWDGKSYWGNVTLEQQERHLAVLRPMLANYPNLPAGYDGWWRF
ncbi:hypothetical protein [Streptomyces sp. WAC05858]|uniref:hypothetical protein n=1 Tax=Streptomyces TaxID=1883 RepID=UPI000F7B3B29|nr:hypothetical protein [Streptomyces sp. WAC05858]RSS37945.1 hypothetical protein EF902_31590 [Streptomyces sp. WAC05858]